jgi:exopolysaccharide biosynthesis polyprenyl glycosylphosphotransferase
MGSTFGAVTGVLFWGLLAIAAFESSSWPLPLAGLLLVVMLRAAARGRKPRRSQPERLLIVGAGPVAQRIAQEAMAAPWRGYVVVGLLDEGEVAPKTVPLKLLRLVRPMAQLETALHELCPDRIVVALNERRGRLPLAGLLRAKAEGVLVDEGLEFWERLTGQVAIETIKPSSLIFSKEFRKPVWTHKLRRAISVLAASLGLILTLPLLLLIAVAVKLESPGPAFFVQPRLGLRGRRFDLIKFRTMHAAAHTSEWAGDNVQRITRLGHWLRKFRVDELPQFWNVLRGDMNLVGPRPHPVSNHDLFLKNIPYYVLRCSVRPGITGWAQVQYGYADNLAEETAKMRYDLYYVKYMSISLDLGILVATISTVLFGNPNHRSTAVKSLPEVKATPRPAHIATAQAGDAAMVALRASR